LDTHPSQIEEALADLQANKDAWVGLTIPERVAILTDLSRDMLSVADRWIESSLAAKGLARQTMGEAEEWLFLAAVLRAIRMARRTLTEIHRFGRPRLPGAVTSTHAGQSAVRVFPRDPWDPIIYRGMTADVWMEPGVTVEAVKGWESGRHLQDVRSGKVALVLGAGNACMLPVVDLLHKLFVEKQVVILKLNPVNDYLGPLMEEGLRALIQGGYLRIVYGGVAQGTYLCRHPQVDELHLTGSAGTFEVIHFGVGAEGGQRKAERRPINVKRFTCELGNISPVIVVPGPWTRADMEEQASQLVTWFIANAGFGCLTPRMIIQHAIWPGRNQFLDVIGRLLEHVEPRRAYYPGARAIHGAFISAHPSARQIGQASSGELPWTIIPGLNPAARDDICFTREAFCSLMAETGLEAPGTVEFIDRSVEFVNETLWGTLNATLLVHPASLRDPQIMEAVERAIARLRYGTVTVNMAAFSGYYFQVAPWGGFPGHTADDIQSGIGKTANFLMLPSPEKSVIRGPFRKFPDPLRVTAHHSWLFARKLALFEGGPSPAKFLSLAAGALRG
jgi:hypothetical protein